MTLGPVLGIDPTAVTDTAKFRPGQLGSVVESPTKMFKYVQYNTGSGDVAAVSGNATAYYTVDGYKNNVVTSDYSDSVNIGAGILQSTPTNGDFCWIQIRGAATMASALTAGGDGQNLTVLGAGDGLLDIPSSYWLTSTDTNFTCAVSADISDKEIICNFLF